MKITGKLGLKILFPAVFWLLLTFFGGMMASAGVSDGELSTILVGGFLAALGLFLGAYVPYNNIQKVNQKAAQLWPENPMGVISMVEELIDRTPVAKKLWVGNGLVWHGGSLYAAHEICWMYQLNTRHRMYGIIPMGTTVTVVIRTADGGTIQIPAKESNAKQIIRELYPLFPNCVAGYSDDWERVYQQNRPQFVAFAKRNH